MCTLKNKSKTKRANDLSLFTHSILLRLLLLQIETDVAAGCSRLHLQEAYPRDAGRYEVSVRNPAGETRAECLVAVKVRPLPSDTSDSEPPPLVVKKVAAAPMEPKAPRIQLPLKDLVIQEGAGARLDCVIVGQPEPEVRDVRSAINQLHHCI